LGMHVLENRRNVKPITGLFSAKDDVFNTKVILFENFFIFVVLIPILAPSLVSELKMLGVEPELHSVHTSGGMFGKLGKRV
jgi:hypothetical protein